MRSIPGQTTPNCARRTGSAVLNSLEISTFQISDRQGQFVFDGLGSTAQLIPVESARQLKNGPFPLSERLAEALENVMPSVPLVLSSDEAALAVGAAAIRALVGRLVDVGIYTVHAPSHN